jgi:type I restriction enzyme S subunit
MRGANRAGDAPALPHGWGFKRLEDVVVECRRGRPPAYEGGTTLVVNQKCVRHGTHVDLAYARRTNEALKALPDWALLEEGDILINSTGTGTLGRVGWLRGVAERTTLDTHVTLVRPDHDQIVSEYLGWWLHSAESNLVNLATGSTNQKELGRESIKSLMIPVPPLDAQARIAERIAGLHAGLERGIRRLEEARTRLLTFRSAAYTNAFSGGTRGLSQDGEEQLEKIATIQSGITKGRSRDASTSEVPYLRTANVQAGFLDLNDVKLIAVTPEQRARHQLRDGDVLVLEGGDADKVGRGWLWEAQIAECLHQNHVFAVRSGHRLRPRFLAHFINAPAARAYFLSVAKQTTNLASINTRNLRGLPVPMFPLDDQEFLVAELDERLASADQMSGAIEAATVRLDELRQSALHQAFRGELHELHDPTLVV